VSSIRVGIIILVALLVAVPAVHAQTLRYGGESGESHTYTRHQTDHVTQTVNGQETQNEIASFWRYDVTVASVGEGEVTFEVVHDSITIDANPTSSGADDFSGVYGKPVGVTMTGRGEVRSVDLPDTLPPSADRLSLQTTYQNMFPRLPEEEVSTGSTWADTVGISTTQNGLDIRVQAVRNYTVGETVERSGHRGYQVDYTTEMEIEGSGAQQGAEISLTGTGAGEGAFWIAPDEGLFLGSEESSEMNMEAFVSAQGQNLLIPIVQTRSETVTLVE